MSFWKLQSPRLRLAPVPVSVAAGSPASSTTFSSAKLGATSSFRSNEQGDRPRCLVASGCASQRPSVRYNGPKVAEPASDVKAYDAADWPCGHVDVGTVEATCPGGCTFDEAIGMAKQRVAQAGVPG
jgi:hypothetical protein